MGNFVVKAVPEDFIVNEVMVLPERNSEEPRHQYLRLRKKGYTTFEAMDLMARHLGVPPDAVSAAGLKDEDGVTIQTVSVDAEVSSAALEEFNGRWTVGTGRWLSLSTVGHGERRIGIGELLGNAFLLTLRGVEGALARQLRELPRGEASVLFANYFDTQRFGVAGGPKVTHLIGEALLNDDHELAFELQRGSLSHEGELARHHAGGARNFFDGLDQRVTAFYRTAHSSYLWNHRLARLLEQHSREVEETDREGLCYVFPRTPQALIGVLADRPELEYDKWRWVGGAQRRRVSSRPTVLQTVVTVGDVEADDMFGGLWKCEVSFMLPSGCYATNVVSQFLLQLSHGVYTR